MTLVDDMLMLVRDPRELFHQRFSSPPSPQLLMAGTVLPLVMIRPGAVLLRSIVTGHPVAGMVLGASSVVLQLGCWVSLAISLPALAKQFGANVGERQAWLLATYASAPLWLAGVLYLVPEDPWMIFFWSRLFVTIAALYGLFLLAAGLEELEIGSRPFIVGSAVAAYVVVYFVLFVLLGLSSHVMLFVLGI